MGLVASRHKSTTAATRIAGARERIAIKDHLQVVGKAHRKPLEWGAGSARRTP